MDRTDSDYLSFPHPRHCPTHTEIILSRKWIERIEEEIEFIDKEQQGLRIQLQLLQQRRENHLSYISPLRCLPMEILEDIFRLCLDEYVRITTLTQVCGSLRNLVHGMSSLWSRLKLDPYSSYRYHPWEGILCSTAERVSVVLEHLGSKPLDLGLYYDTQPNILEPIIMRNHPIGSLTMDWTDGIDNVNQLGLDRLNFGSLGRLSLIELNIMDTVEVMNIVKRSITGNIELKIDFAVEMPSNFAEYELLRCVTKLDISAGLDEIPPNPVSLPCLKSLRIRGNQELFGVFLLGNLEILDLDLVSHPRDLVLTSLPPSLIRMTLKSVKLLKNNTSPSHISYLPNLVDLNIEDAVIQGPLHNYFKCLQLKHLHLGNIEYYSMDHESRSDSRVGAFTFPKRKLPSSIWSSQDFPNLQSLSLSWMTIDQSSVNELQKHSGLQRLTLHDVATDTFFPSFIDSLENDGFLPHLSRLDISRSWPHVKIIPSRDELIKRCETGRPYLQIYIFPRSSLIWSNRK